MDEKTLARMRLSRYRADPAAQAWLEEEDQAHVRQFVEFVRWGGKPVCPRCGGRKAWWIYDSHSFAPYKCASCRKPFSWVTGTALHRTHIPLSWWMRAIVEVISNPNREDEDFEESFSFRRPAWYTGRVPKLTKSRMVKRIRWAMAQSPLKEALQRKNPALGTVVHAFLDTPHIPIKQFPRKQPGKTRG